MTKATSLWRISKRGAKVDDLNGAGAASLGGRWNAKGTPVVYTSTAISLAALETLAHWAGKVAIRDSFLIKLTVPNAVWAKRKTVTAATLPLAWLAQPPGPASVNVGNSWLVANSEAVMLVPSVIIPEEYNALINPTHPEAVHIRATVVRHFTYDPRLI